MEKNAEAQVEVKQPAHNEIIDNAIGKLRENTFKVYFYCPPMNSPSGGVGVLLRAAKNLKDNGFNVSIVYEPIHDQKASYEASVKAKRQIDVFDKFNPKWVDFSISDIEFNRYRDWETDRKSTRLNSSHSAKSRMPSSA